VKSENPDSVPPRGVKTFRRLVKDLAYFAVPLAKLLGRHCVLPCLVFEKIQCSAMTTAKQCTCHWCGRHCSVHQAAIFHNAVNMPNSVNIGTAEANTHTPEVVLLQRRADRDVTVT
jgi:hypothetical protein